MKISANKKREILLETFETLKGNYSENCCALFDLMGKMSKIDLNTSLEMWKYLIKNNQEALHTTDDFSFQIMYNVEKAIGDAKAYEIVATDSFLKNALFHESGEIGLCLPEAISLFIVQNRLSLVNELMELVFTNKYRCDSFYTILENAIPEGEEISEEAFDLLNEWIKKIIDKEERAKLHLKMLSFMDEDDN